MKSETSTLAHDLEVDPVKHEERVIEYPPRSRQLLLLFIFALSQGVDGEIFLPR
jgi:hypothetical protein